MDALSAELTATESEAITAGGDKIRGEVESGRIAAALSQARAAGEMPVSYTHLDVYKRQCWSSSPTSWT